MSLFFESFMDAYFLGLALNFWKESSSKTQITVILSGTN
jgi:hypothetical protein